MISAREAGTSNAAPTPAARARRSASERTHHLAGPLGVQLLSALCEAGWLRRSKDSRAVRVTPKGWTQLKAQLGLDPRDLEKPEQKQACGG
ncbi:ArsR family transcriptional regulator [Pseudomonas antarctica]|uniref:ArsR family transcriptional regulator n=1 Tax=Pseudomonas antarctica TaxID=219572 RepID=UPI00345D68DC